jgi:hypothetical protein
MTPGNIKAAVNHIDYQKGTNNGPGPTYLWFRIPLQLFFIGWVCFFWIWNLDEKIIYTHRTALYFR